LHIIAACVECGRRLLSRGSSLKNAQGPSHAMVLIGADCTSKPAPVLKSEKAKDNAALVTAFAHMTRHKL